MHHHVKALNVVVKGQAAFPEHFAAHTPTIQLCEGVFRRPPNETVAIIILGHPSGEVSFFGYGVRDHTMGMSWKPPIKPHNLSFFELTNCGPAFFENSCIAARSARQPSHPPVLTQMIHQQKKFENLVCIFGFKKDVTQHPFHQTNKKSVTNQGDQIRIKRGMIIFIQSAIKIQFVHLVHKVLQTAPKLPPNCFLVVAAVASPRDVVPRWIVLQDV